MKKRVRLALLGVSASLLSGCASQTVFYKQGATEADFEMDRQACQNRYYQNKSLDDGNAAALADLMMGAPQYKACLAEKGWSEISRDRLDTFTNEVPSLRFGFLFEDGLVIFVQDGSPAEKAGLQICDLLVSVAGTDILYNNDILAAEIYEGQPADIVVRRVDREVTLVATPEVMMMETPAETVLAANRAECQAR